MRRAARKDENHDLIRDALTHCGWTVHETYQLPGFCDLVAWKKSHGFVLIEVKDGRKPPSARKLTEAEQELARKMPVRVVEKLEDVIEMSHPEWSTNWARQHCS